MEVTKLEIEAEKSERFPATKYCKQISLAGLICLVYIGARHMFGAETLNYQFNMMELKNLPKTADFFIGGAGIFCSLASAVYTPLFYLLEKYNS